MHTIPKDMQYAILYAYKEMYNPNAQMVPVLAKKTTEDSAFHFKALWKYWVSFSHPFCCCSGQPVCSLPQSTTSHTIQPAIPKAVELAEIIVSSYTVSHVLAPTLIRIKSLTQKISST